MYKKNHLRFSLEILSWPLHSCIPSVCLLTVYSSGQVPQHKLTEKKIGLNGLPVFLSSFRTVNEVSTRFEEIHTLTNPEPNQMKQGRKCPQIITNTRVPWLSQTSFWKVNFSLMSFSLFRDYKEDTKIPICIISESLAIRMTSTNQTKKKSILFNLGKRAFTSVDTTTCTIK